MTRSKRKVGFSPDKVTWSPSPLLGQVVLVTTQNADGTSNLAPKSWISMRVYRPPLLAIGCNRDHWTAQNILERGDFVVNIPGDDLAAAVWRCSALPHPRPVESAGLTPLPASEVAPPWIAECRAHLECVLAEKIEFGREVVLFGEILAVSVDEAALESEDPYTYLRPFVFLEAGSYGVVERRSHVELPAT